MFESFSFAKLMKIILWFVPVQKSMLDFVFAQDNQLIVVFKWIFLLLPVLMVIVGVWCTMLAVILAIFRSDRNSFIAVMFITWWDSLRSCWLFWTGAFRFVWLAVGWTFNLFMHFIMIIVALIKQVLLEPFIFIGKMSKQYFKSGIPWIAVLFTLFWVVLEGFIFTTVLFPTMNEVVSALTGYEPNPALLASVLYFMLTVVAAGSFVCLQLLAEAVKNKKIMQMLQMLLLEFFVAFFEVIFLYREFVDVITPWIAQKTGYELGVVGVISGAFLAWLAIRIVAWFLFAQYGTTTLIAIIARKPIQGVDEETQKRLEVSLTWTKDVVNSFKTEINWFHGVSKELLESLALPALQVVASTINFCMVLFSSKPLFSLPFKHIEEVMETRELIQKFEQQKKHN